ncbi:MAG: hypothetical protein WBO55_16165 [Rhizobiaceae bacterium]
MKTKRHLVKLVIAAAIAAGNMAPSTASAEEVYFIRGFMNVFSAGMDQMAAKLRSRGVNAKSYSNGAWQGLASDIIRRHQQGTVSFPIVIAGHSVGGQEAPQFANKLAQAGVPVALVIGVDPGFAPPPPFTSGSPRVINYWIQGSARGNPYRASGGFGGNITNINIATFSRADHVGIDKDPAVQSRIISNVLSAVGG